MKIKITSGLIALCIVYLQPLVLPLAFLLLVFWAVVLVTFFIVDSSNAAYRYMEHIANDDSL